MGSLRAYIIFVLVLTFGTAHGQLKTTSQLPVKLNLDKFSKYPRIDCSILLDPFQSNRLPMSFNSRGTTLLLKRNATNVLNISSPHLPLFCQLEYKADQKTKVPFRVRLGSLDYVNYLEQKPGYTIRPNY